MLSETQQTQDTQQQPISNTHMQSGLMSQKDKMQKYNFWMQWLVAKKLVLRPQKEMVFKLLVEHSPFT